MKLWLTRSFHATVVIELLSLDNSHNILAWVVQLDQRYTQDPSPTLKTFWDDQSRRLRQKQSWSSGASSTFMKKRSTLSIWTQSNITSAMSLFVCH
jgi:hypothetical protein